jgi:hypothetical protein
MRLPRFRIRTLMIAVAVVGIVSRPVVWLWEEYRDFVAYSEWAGDTL